MRLVAVLTAALALSAPAFAQDTAPAMPPPAEIPPYEVSDANAHATPMKDDAVYRAFGEKAGIERVVARLVKLYRSDPRLKDIFAAADDERLSRMLVEQICYITGGPCRYTGQDMKAVHTDMGVQMKDFNALVEVLQIAMDAEKVSFSAQNKLLAKLAPMKRVIVER